jgi:hypothetical protein
MHARVQAGAASAASLSVQHNAAVVWRNCDSATSFFALGRPHSHHNLHSLCAGGCRTPHQSFGAPFTTRRLSALVQAYDKAVSKTCRGPECSATALLGLRNAAVPRTGVAVPSSLVVRGGLGSLLTEPGGLTLSGPSKTKWDCLTTAGLLSPGIWSQRATQAVSCSLLGLLSSD